IVDFADRLGVLPTSDQIWAAFTSFARPYGFEYAGYADMPGPGKRLADTIICNSLPEDWCQHYLRCNYVTRDPMALYLFQAHMPFTLEDVRDTAEYESDQLRIFGERSEFGVKSVFSVPLRSPSNGPAAISVV